MSDLERKGDKNATPPQNSHDAQWKIRNGHDLMAVSGLGAGLFGLLFAGAALQAGGIIAALCSPLVAVSMVCMLAYTGYRAYQGAKLAAEGKVEQAAEQRNEQLTRTKIRTPDVGITAEDFPSIVSPGPTPLGHKSSKGRGL